ncbi:MAG TPA: lamin tail domain-containing protein, partial [Pyrinomonadaceae bacterium]|nr:lamin tail domain-containing protein [Pyrinomonadaceae bacterium]
MRLISPLHPTRQSRVFVATAIVVLAIFAFMLFLSFSSRVQAISSNIVISEFRVRGPAGGNDEFVELYTLSGAPVAIGGWAVRGS